MSDNRPSLDLSLPAAAMLAQENHSPYETWRNGSGWVECAKCEQDWPCATRKKLSRQDYVLRQVPIDRDVLKAFIDLYTILDTDETFFDFNEYKIVIETRINDLRRLVGE